MDSFEINKLLAAILGTLFVGMSTGIIADSIFAAPVPERPGFVIEAAEAESDGAEFRLASIPPGFNVPYRQIFDPEYMKALFAEAYALGSQDRAWVRTPPEAGASLAAR